MTGTCPMTEAPFQGDYFPDPYTTYAHLRDAGSAHRITLPDGSEAWLVTHYDDVRQGLRDQRLARNRRHAGPGYKNELFPEAVRYGNIVMEDAEAHARLRSFVIFAFTPKRVEAMRPRIEQVVAQSLDAIEGKGEVDLMDALAAPVPITIIADILGIPERHRTDFRKWSDLVFGSDLDKARSSAISLLNYVAYLIEVKREEPADDLISHWITTPDAEGRHLAHNEILGMTYFMLIGGYDTTVGMIGTAALTLLRHPEHAEKFRSTPDAVGQAVEELMRWDGCLQTGVRRFATEDLTVGGTRIPAGDTVLLSIGAASRDGRRFPDADTLDFSRSDKSHLLFGMGPHHCPGAELGRMEVTVALSQLLQRFPEIKLAVPADEVEFRDSYVIRTPLSLPVTLAP